MGNIETRYDGSCIRAERGETGTVLWQGRLYGWARGQDTGLGRGVQGGNHAGDDWGVQGGNPEC